MTDKEFVQFVEEVLKPEIISFSNTNPFSDSGKTMLVSWAHQDDDEEAPFGQAINYVKVDLPKTNSVRIFFTERANKVANVNMAQLIFSLNKSGVIHVSSALEKYKKPDLLHEINDAEAQLGPATIYSFLENQFNDQISW